MVPDVGGFSLQLETDRLEHRECLAQRQVVIESVGTVEIGDTANAARRHVGRDELRVGAAGTVRAGKVLGIDEQGVGLAGNAVNTYGMLQLRNADTVEYDAAVAVIVEGEVAAGELLGRAGLEGGDGAHGPVAQHAAGEIVSAEKHLALAEGEIVGAGEMESMADVKLRGAVGETRVAQGEGIGPGAPSVVGAAGDAAGAVGVHHESEGVAVGVVGIELQARPASLSQIDLQRVVV